MIPTEYAMDFELNFEQDQLRIQWVHARILGLDHACM